MATFQPHEIAALRFLEINGPHQIGTIDSDEKMAAALGFIEMRKKGLVWATVEEGGPKYRITTGFIEMRKKGLVWATVEEGGPKYRITTLGKSVLKHYDFPLPKTDFPA